MVSIPYRYEETTYGFPSIHPEYFYQDAYPGYAFDQTLLPKNCSHPIPLEPLEPFSENIYSNWMELTTDGNHLADNQAIQEQYATGYSYNAAATVYMAKRYHAMEYEFNTGLPINPGLLPNFTTECPSSNCSSIDTPPYPPTTWSPSEPSVASLSSPYEVHLEKMGFAARTEYPLDDTDEVLQGLGLYDCPELATDCGSLDELCSSYLGLGKGLKLEESFEFKEYSDDEEDEEDEEEYDEN